MQDITNKDLFNLYEGLSEIAQDREIKFDIQLSYILAYNRRILEPYYQAISETREVLFQKYGERTEEGWRILKENINDFQQEWQKFMGIINSISLKEIKLSDIPNTQISVDLMGKLLSIIKE